MILERILEENIEMDAEMLEWKVLFDCGKLDDLIEMDLMEEERENWLWER